MSGRNSDDDVKNDEKPSPRKRLRRNMRQSGSAAASPNPRASPPPPPSPKKLVATGTGTGGSGAVAAAAAHTRIGQPITPAERTELDAIIRMLWVNGKAYEPASLITHRTNPFQPHAILTGSVIPRSAAAAGAGAGVRDPPSDGDESDGADEIESANSKQSGSTDSVVSRALSVVGISNASARAAQTSISGRYRNVPKLQPAQIEALRDMQTAGAWPLPWNALERYESLSECELPPDLDDSLPVPTATASGAAAAAAASKPKRSILRVKPEAAAAAADPTDHTDHKHSQPTLSQPFTQPVLLPIATAADDHTSGGAAAGVGVEDGVRITTGWMASRGAVPAPQTPIPELCPQLDCMLQTAARSHNWLMRSVGRAV